MNPAELDRLADLIAERLVEPPAFDRHAFTALAGESERLIGRESTARALVKGWTRQQLEEPGVRDG